MIEDKELRTLFQAESEERLNHLEAGLKQLETDLMNQSIIEEIFRDAHTIKGAARMLAITSIERIAHALEDGLGACRQAALVFTPPIFSLFYEAIDTLRLLANEAVSGAPANVNSQELLNRLDLKNLQSLQKVGPAPQAEQTALPSETIHLMSPPAPKGDETPRSNVEIQERKIVEKIVKQSLKSSIIRINMQQLSELTTQAGDLTVVKNRIMRIFDLLEEFMTFWEYQMREFSQYRYTKSSLSSGSSSARPENITNKPLENDSLSELFNLTEKKINELRVEAYGNFHKLEVVVLSLTDKINRLGLVPFSKLFDLFPKMVQELSAVCSKEVQFLIEGGDILVDRKIIEDMKDPLMHLLRNALDHGIETPSLRETHNKPRSGIIRLNAKQTANTIIIEVADDGNGLDIEKIKQNAIKRKMYSESDIDAMTDKQIEALIFLPGLSTKNEVTELSGRGVGLDVVRVGIEKLNGTIQLESFPTKGCKFIIQLPTTLVTTHVVLFQVKNKTYCLPIEAIEFNAHISLSQIFLLEGRYTINLHDNPLTIINLADLLDNKKNSSDSEISSLQGSSKPCIILRSGKKSAAFIVDAILDEQKVVITPSNEFCSGLPLFAGVNILKTGVTCIALNPNGLIDLAQQDSSQKSSLSLMQNIVKEYKKKKILAVDDSQLSRLILKRALEGESYDVVTAENGEVALKILNEMAIDAVVTDAEMPKMDGFTLIAKIREQNQYYLLPIIMVTTLSSAEDKKKAFDLGSNAFLTKSSFNQQILLKTLKDLLHE
jgi:two-component system chemotaxis sensor kinase CheA